MYIYIYMCVCIPVYTYIYVYVCVCIHRRRCVLQKVVSLGTSVHVVAHTCGHALLVWRLCFDCIVIDTVIRVLGEARNSGHGVVCGAHSEKYCRNEKSVVTVPAVFVHADMCICGKWGCCDLRACQCRFRHMRAAEARNPRSVIVQTQTCVVEAWNPHM